MNVAASMTAVESFASLYTMLVPISFCIEAGYLFCEGSGYVVGVLTLLVGGLAQAFHDDRVVELTVQVGVEEVDGEGQEGTGRSRKGEANQRGAPMDMNVEDKVFAQDLSQ